MIDVQRLSMRNGAWDGPLASMNENAHNGALNIRGSLKNL
jgi:hypothetical protein